MKLKWDDSGMKWIMNRAHLCQLNTANWSVVRCAVHCVSDAACLWTQSCQGRFSVRLVALMVMGWGAPGFSMAGGAVNIAQTG